MHRLYALPDFSNDFSPTQPKQMYGDGILGSRRCRYFPLLRCACRPTHSRLVIACMIRLRCKRSLSLRDWILTKAGTSPASMRPQARKQDGNLCDRTAYTCMGFWKPMRMRLSQRGVLGSTSDFAGGDAARLYQAVHDNLFSLSDAVHAAAWPCQCCLSRRFRPTVVRGVCRKWKTIACGISSAGRLISRRVHSVILNAQATGCVRAYRPESARNGQLASRVWLVRFALWTRTRSSTTHAVVHPTVRRRAALP